MKNTKSLKKTPEFRNVYKRGKSVVNKHLVLYKYPNKLSHNRLGISVSKKVGKSVIRSRVTRLIKESYRLQEDQIVLEGYDLVIIARTAASEASYQEIFNALQKLLRQNQLIHKNS